METIIVEICIGSIGRVMDFMLPAHVPVGKLIGDLVSLIEQTVPEVAFGNETPLLLSMADQKAIPENWTLAKAGIRDSHRLMIV